MIAINENVVTPELDALKNAGNQALVETKGHKSKSSKSHKTSNKNNNPENSLIPIQNELDTKADKQSHCSSRSSSDGLTPPSSGSSGTTSNDYDQ